MITRYAVFIVLFVLFIIEGTVYQVFAPDFHGSPYQFIPRWMFMLLLLNGIFRGRGYGLFYGVILGLLYDIVYGQVLGIYTFGMGLVGYLLSVSAPFIKKNISVAFLTVLTGVILLEYYVYGMMLLLGITTTPHEMFMSERFLPTIIMNGVILLIVIIPVRLWLEYVDKRIKELNG